MSLEYIETVCSVTACYLTDGDNKVYPGENYEYYHPFISDVEFKPTTDIKIVHANDVCNNIDAFDANASNKRLNQRVKEEKKIDVTMGDINVAPSQVMLNFTDFDLVCYNSLNFPTVLRPLDTKALKELYRGRVLIMTIHRLPTPANVERITGTNHNYIDIMLRHHNNRTNINVKTKNLINVLEFANKCWINLSKVDRDYSANSIKVVTFSLIHQDAFINKKSTESGKDYHDLYITDYDLLLTKDSILNYKINPAMNKSLDSNVLKDVVLHGSRYIYIVDRENAIGDRYVNMHGDVKKIAKLSKGEYDYHSDGLYTGIYDSKLGIMPDTMVKLSEINTLSYVYPTIEEALHGANKSELFNQQLTEQRQKYEAERLHKEAEITRLKNLGHQQETEFQAFKRDLEGQLLREKNDYARERNEYESRLLREKNNYESKGYGMKSYFDERKYERDDVSYARESNIETLKTVASVCGVLATGYLIYTKLAKA